MGEPTALPTPSPWVTRFAPQIRDDGSVLDLACGNGRHLRYLMARGHHVVGVDVDISGVQGMAGSRCEILPADLEHAPWPLGSRTFAAVVVTNYLHRPLFPRIAAAVEEGGLLIYETFTDGQDGLGRPGNPDFLLRPGELLQLADAAGLRVVAYERGLTAGAHGRDPMPDGQPDTLPDASLRQRLCAVRGGAVRGGAIRGGPEVWIG